MFAGTGIRDPVTITDGKGGESAGPDSGGPVGRSSTRIRTLLAVRNSNLSPVPSDKRARAFVRT